MGTRADEDLEDVNVDEVDEEELEKGHAGPDANSKSEGSPTNTEGEGRKYTTSKITVGIDEEIAQRLRAAVYHIPGLTMYGVMEKGIEDVLDRIEEKVGGIPEYDGKLRGGPDPVKELEFTDFDAEDFFS